MGWFHRNGSLDTVTGAEGAISQVLIQDWSVTDRNLDATLAWLRSSRTRPIPKGWVPGAADHERQALGTLGSVAAHSLNSAPPASWPPPILDWLATSLPLPDAVAEEVDKALTSQPDEALAELYARLVAGPRRRVLGTFFTPADEVGLMLQMWDKVERPPTSVFDVGAGVGVFTAAAANQWQQAQVTAIDVNPVALGLLCARMAQPDAADACDRVRLVLEDVTSWLPLQARHPGERRLTLGNPPYTRWQLIEPGLRTRLVEQTTGLCASRASLSAFITALTLSHLHQDDGLCLLLPAQWLESDYSRGLRKHLLSLQRRPVELRLVRSTWFADARVDAVILLVGTERAEPQRFTIAEWGQIGGRDINRAAPTAEGWRTWFRGHTQAQTQSTPNTKRLRDLARVRRGTATGANEFFLLSDDRVAELDLPTSALTPVVRRLNEYATKATQHRFDRRPAHERKWLLTVDADEVADNDQIRAYIQSGEADAFDQRHLCMVRASDWYDLAHDLYSPDIIITAMTRDAIHVVDNDIGAVITNNLYGWVWDADVTKKIRGSIVKWLRSEAGQAALMARCRSQGNGLAKIEPAALADLELPGHIFG